MDVLQYLAQPVSQILFTEIRKLAFSTMAGTVVINEFPFLNFCRKSLKVHFHVVHGLPYQSNGVLRFVLSQHFDAVKPHALEFLRVLGLLQRIGNHIRGKWTCVPVGEFDDQRTSLCAEKSSSVLWGVQSTSSIGLN
jgi:hypothetical protein